MIIECCNCEISDSEDSIIIENSDVTLGILELKIENILISRPSETMITFKNSDIIIIPTILLEKSIYLFNKNNKNKISGIIYNNKNFNINIDGRYILTDDSKLINDKENILLYYKIVSGYLLDRLVSNISETTTEYNIFHEKNKYDYIEVIEDGVKKHNIVNIIKYSKTSFDIVGRENIYTKIASGSLSNMPKSIRNLNLYNINSIGYFLCIDSLIETVNFSDNLKEIEFFAFARCHNIKNINLPDSCEIIDSGAFNTCSKLESVKTGSGLKIIKCFSFKDCMNLEKMDFSNSFNIETIEHSAFYNCHPLKILIFNIKNSEKFSHWWLDGLSLNGLVFNNYESYDTSNIISEMVKSLYLKIDNKYSLMNRNVFILRYEDLKIRYLKINFIDNFNKFDNLINLLDYISLVENINSIPFTTSY